MRRRSSSSDEEDDAQAPPAEAPPRQKDPRPSFTSANFDRRRHLDTLDQRKGNRNPLTQAASNGWKTPTETRGGQSKNPLVPDIASTDNMPGSRVWRRSGPKSPWSCSLLTLSATILAALALFSIIHSFLTRQLDPKGCEMYWSRALFIKFNDFDTEHTRFASKYSLYLYREGYFDEDPKVKGVPVLFIPGNAGSYKQARSLGSESAQYYYNSIAQDSKALKDGATSIDFFTIDFNEDFTAFHGQTVLDQAEYLNDAVAYILSLYHDPKRSHRDPSLPDPSSVILIGHSMGGIVARTMLTMPNYQSNSVNTIVTMSTPHARPPVAFDGDIVRTYKQTNGYWRGAYAQKWANDNPLWHVTLISIAGGGLDTVVPSDYASLSSLVPTTHGFTVFTSSIPNVWTGADHLAMVWCAQLVKPIIRSIFDTIDVRRPSQTKPRAERMRVFKRWLLTGLEEDAEKSLHQKEPSTLLTLEDNSNSILPMGRRLVLRGFGNTKKPKAHLLPIPPQAIPGGKKFTLLSDQPTDESGSNGNLEVLFCSVFPLAAGQSASLFAINMDLSDGTSGSTRLACKNAASDRINLPASSRTSIHPFDQKSPFSYLQYNLDDLVEHQFVAVVDKATTPSDGWVIAEFTDNSHSSIQSRINLQTLLTLGIHFKLPAKRAVVVEMHIPALQSSLLAFKLKLGKQPCGEHPELFTPLLRQYVSEPHESKYFVNVKEANISLHGVAPFMPPPMRNQALNNGVSLQLWSDPTCESSLDVSLKVDIPGTLGKLVMRYRMVLAAFPLLVVAMVLRKQFKVHDEFGFFITFSESMDLCLRTSLPLLLLALVFLGISLAIASITPSKPSLFRWRANATEAAIDYTKNDLLLGSQDPTFWFLVPLSGLLSAGACVLVNYAALGLTYFLSTLYSLLIPRLSCTKGDDRKLTTPLFSAISPRRRLITTSILLFLVSTFIPYQFAYLVTVLVQLATCVKAFLLTSSPTSPYHHQHTGFHAYAHSILVLMLFLLPLNGPVLVVWLHNLAVHWLTPFSSHHNVLSIMPFILLVETVSGGKMIPRCSGLAGQVTSALLFGMALFAAVYGVTYAYLLHHFANAVVAWLVCVHVWESRGEWRGLRELLEGVEEEEEGGGKKMP